MAVRPIVECNRSEEQNRNTGAKEQCLEGVTIRHALAPSSQEFASLSSFKSLADWKTARDAKDIIPLYEIENLAAADTEDTVFEGNSTYTTKKGKKIRTFECFLGLCSHAALASYHNKVMRVYEFTDDQGIKGVTPDGTKVRGQLVKVKVGKRMDPMPDKPAFTPVTLEYQDFHEYENGGVFVKPEWSHLDIEGIFDATITVVSASATSVKFTVDSGCAGELIKSLENTDLIFVTSSGTAITHSFVDADENGVYEFTGTAFPNNSKIDLNGVVVKTEATYESLGPTTVTIS